MGAQNSKPGNQKREVVIVPGAPVEWLLIDSLHFQVGGRTRRPNLGFFSCFTLFYVIVFVFYACLFVFSRFLVFVFSVPAKKLAGKSISEMTHFVSSDMYKNSSGDEIANVNSYSVRPEATRIHRNNAK